MTARRIGQQAAVIAAGIAGLAEPGQWRLRSSVGILSCQNRAFPGERPNRIRPTGSTLACRSMIACWPATWTSRKHRSRRLPWASAAPPANRYARSTALIAHCVA